MTDQSASDADQSAAASVPLIVHAAAGIGAILALLYAVVVSVTFVSLGWGIESFGISLALLLGQTVGIEGTGGIPLIGRVDAGLSFRMAPFGLVVIGAIALTRIGFTRAWLQVRGMWWLPLIGGISVTAVLGFLALIVGNQIEVSATFVDIGVRVRPSLVGLIVIGAGPWLLAVAYVRSSVARLTVLVILALQGVLALVVLTGGDRLLSDFVDGASIAPFVFFLVALAYGAQLAAWLLTWPFGGRLGLSGELARLAPTDTSFGFLDAADLNGWLWLVPVASIALVLVVTYRLIEQMSPIDLGKVILHGVGTVTLVMLPMLWFGRLSVRASGQASTGGPLDLVADVFDLPLRSTNVDRMITATLGPTGMPFRAILALISWSLLAAVIAFLIAQQRGIPVAIPATLRGEGSFAATGLVERARTAASRATEAAQRVDATQQPPSAAPDGRPSTPPVGPATFLPASAESVASPAGSEQRPSPSGGLEQAVSAPDTQAPVDGPLVLPPPSGRKLDLGTTAEPTDTSESPTT